MKKVMIAAGLILSVLMVIGCAGKQRAEMNEAAIQSIVSENRALRDKVTELEQKVERVEASTKSEAEALKEENLKMKASLSEMEKKVSAPPPPPPPPPSPPAKPREVNEEKRIPEAKKGRINVLSGTGDIRSAAVMATRLKGLGYNVMRVEMAGRGDYKVNTVYYASGFQPEAEALAKASSGEIKPLSWKSTFDLIVITGKSSN